MKLTITHTTRYSYDQPLTYALQQLRLTPKSRAGQTVISWETEVDGGTRQVSYDDQHNNKVDLISFDDGRTEVTVRCHGVVETSDRNGIVGEHGGFAPLWYFHQPTALTKPGPLARKLIKAVPETETGVMQMHALSAEVLSNIRYQTGETHAATTSEEALEHGYGVCQDHAHVFVTAARLMGHPARYVSGYLMMDDRVDQDATHAWAEVWLEGLGWVGFDVSNAISPDERYVRVATGLDYNDAAPVSGLRFGVHGDESMLVTVQVQQ